VIREGRNPQTDAENPAREPLRKSAFSENYT
jgi:hypothetical protein